MDDSRAKQEGPPEQERSPPEIEQAQEIDAQGYFVQLFAQHQRRVHAYIGSLLPNRTDADDVMQETSLVLWKKWDQFDKNRKFLPWACGVALLEVLKFRRLRGASRCVFNEELVKSLAIEAMDQLDSHDDSHDERRLVLRGCLKQLGDSDRQLIEHRYQSAITAKQTAADLGRPASTVYKALVRIREALFQCVQRKIAQKAH